MRRKWQADFSEMLQSGVNINSMARIAEFVDAKLAEGYEVRKEHLLKLYFYPEGTQYHGVWMRSVFSATHEVFRLKRSNKFPDRDFIYESIWLSMDPQDIHSKLDGYVEIIAGNNQYLQSPELPLDQSIIDDCMKYLYAYHEWLAEALSKKGYVKSFEVYGKLKELLSQSIYRK